ncbi:MAG: 1-deoxy-D-xylulose-5-phosphate reductoisomerase, partial [Glycomyces artemisiae]|nr:1-deoxy-D-xylulose-5-phosphate reductoisomerase [Glycomyces artemisiae]
MLLGSTGSIGTQAIDIVRANPDRFRVTAIGAGGSNPALLAEQAVELGVEAVAVADATALEAVQLRLFAAAKERSWDTGGFKMPKLIAGPNAMTEIAAWQAHTVLNGINGS